MGKTEIQSSDGSAGGPIGDALDAKRLWQRPTVTHIPVTRTMAGTGSNTDGTSPTPTP